MLTQISVDVVSSSKAFETLSRVSRRQLPCEDVESLIEVASYILTRNGLPEEASTFMDLLDFVLSSCFLGRSIRQGTPLSAEFLEARFSGEDEEVLEKAREFLIIELSALSGRPNAALHWPINSRPLETMLDWIEASHFQIRICALTMLGNFAYQSEILTTGLIQEKCLSDRMANLLKSETNGLVLKTALGAMQMFARNVQHRLLLGQSGILAGIAPNWEQGTNLPLQQAALSTTRHLLNGSLDNINRFLSEQAPPRQSLLHRLLDAFETSEMSETRSDIAWTLERIWRFVYSDSDVRRMCEDEEYNCDSNATATVLLRETISYVYQTYPRILEPFLVILTSGNKDHVVAATYTLTTMMNEEKVYDAVYNTLCVGDGRSAFLATIQDTENPKAQLNAHTLLQKLKIHFVSAGLR